MKFSYKLKLHCFTLSKITFQTQISVYSNFMSEVSLRRMLGENSNLKFIYVQFFEPEIFVFE